MFRKTTQVPPNDGIGLYYEHLVGKAVEIGTILFEVYAFEEMPDDLLNIDEQEGKLIGHITSTNEFTTSLWGDERLYFRYQLAQCSAGKPLPDTDTNVDLVGQDDE